MDNSKVSHTWLIKLLWCQERNNLVTCGWEPVVTRQWCMWTLVGPRREAGETWHSNHCRVSFRAGVRRTCLPLPGVCYPHLHHHKTLEKQQNDLTAKLVSISKLFVYSPSASLSYHGYSSPTCHGHVCRHVYVGRCSRGGWWIVTVCCYVILTSFELIWLWLSSPDHQHSGRMRTIPRL